MTFLNSILLWSGLALAAGPIIIHLLNRRRFRILDWAAMEFLLESVRRNRRRVRIEELLLLLLRILVIALMGAALARPFVGERSLASVLGMKARADHIIVLDDSYSMAQRIGTETIFDRARNAVAKIAERAAPEDTFAVLLVSRKGEPFFAPQNLTDLAGFKADLKSVVPSDLATDLVTPLERAREILADSKNPEKRLYLLTDFRQREWDFAAGSSRPTEGGQVSSSNIGQGQKLKAVLDKIEKQRLKIFLLDFGLDDPANLGVTEFIATDKHVVRGMRAQFRATVVNRGTVPVRNIPVTFTVGGNQFPARVIEQLNAGETASLQFSYTFAEEGAQAMTVELPADSLSPDNAAHLALDTRAAVPVLVVNGSPDDTPYVNEPDYFLAAIDPSGKGLSGYRPKVVTEATLSNVKLSDFDVVLLANLARMPKLKLAELESYVRAGGGLVIFLGDKIDRDFYNNEFFNDGAGLQPLHLEPPRGDALDLDQFVRLKVESASHPILGIFAGLGGALIERVHFHSYYATQRADESRSGNVRDAAGLKVLATFTDRDQTPALVEKVFGKGKVLVFTSTLSGRWNDWPRNPSYPIAMNEMVSYLARPSVASKTAPVGEPIHRDIETEFLGANITVKTPMAEEAPLKLVATATKNEGETFYIVFDKADRAGLYTLDLAAPSKSRRDFFGRNVEPVEGDLVKIDNVTLTQRLQDLPVTYLTKLATAELNLSEEAKGKEFWRYALFALLGLLVIESLLALRFGHYAK